MGYFSGACNECTDVTYYRARTNKNNYYNSYYGYPYGGYGYGCGYPYGGYGYDCY